jgi:prophage regulatory protein
MQNLALAGRHHLDRLAAVVDQRQLGGIAAYRETGAGMSTEQDRLLRISEVEEIVGIKRAMIYRLIRRGAFPQQFKPGGYASRWSEAEIRAWRKQQRAATDV